MHKLMLNGRQPDVLDKIRSNYLEGKKLSAKQEDRRKKYERAHTLRINGYSKEQTVHMLVEMSIVGSVTEAYRIVNSAERLFGDVNTSNREGLRHILTENLMAVYREARKQKDLKQANKSLEIIGKINGLADNAPTPIDWSKIIIPIPVYTTDANILRQAERNETIDIPHEEVKK